MSPMLLISLAGLLGRLGPVLSPHGPARDGLDSRHPEMGLVISALCHTRYNAAAQRGWCGRLGVAAV